jgi:hypothetical protein
MRPIADVASSNACTISIHPALVHTVQHQMHTNFSHMTFMPVRDMVEANAGVLRHTTCTLLML